MLVMSFEPVETKQSTDNIIRRGWEGATRLNYFCMD